MRARQAQDLADRGQALRLVLRSVIVAALAFAAHAFAARGAAAQIIDPVDWTRSFAERLVAQGGQAAYDYWAEGTRGNFNAEGQQQFRGVLVDLAPQAGVVRQVSAMTEEHADERVVRVRTLFHLAANPFLITFYFYRPDNDWRLMTWVTSNQAADMPYGPPRSVPVGVTAPPPAPVTFPGTAGPGTAGPGTPGTK
jgi:hypothetical protein